MVNEWLINVMWGIYIVILIQNPDYGYQPLKSISLIVMGRDGGPGISVCLYSMSVRDLVLVMQPLQMTLQRTAPTLVSIVLTSRWAVYRLVEGFLTDSAVSL